MRTLPSRRILALVYATAAFALIILTLGARLVPHLTLTLRVETAGLGLAILFARRFPVHLTEKTKTSIATAPLFAAVLLLPAPLALLAAALGTLGAELWRRSRFFQGLFNASITVLQVGAGSLCFSLLVGRGSLASPHPAAWLLPALLAALLTYLTGMLLVESIVSVQLQCVVLARFWDRTWLSLPQEGLLSLLGLVLALVLVQAPWAALLLPAPAWLVYRSLRTTAEGLIPAGGAAPAHLAQLPRRLQLAIVATCATSTVAGLAALLFAPGTWSPASLILATLATILGAGSYKLPIKPAPKRTLVLDGAFILAALLVLAPGATVLVVAVLVAAGNTLQRRHWFNTLFNVAQNTLAALAASLLYHALTPTPLTGGLSAGGVAAAVAAAAAFWLTSCLLVDGITAVQLGRSPFPTWLSIHRQSLLAHAILLPLGIAIVPVLSAAPWVLTALLLPATLVRVLVRTAVQLDGQTELLVDDLVGAVAAQYPALPEAARRASGLAAALAAAYGLPADACRRIAVTARLAVCADELLPSIEAETASHDVNQLARLRLLRLLLETPAVAETLTYRRTAFDGSSDAAGPRGAAIPITARVLALCDGWLRLAAAQPRLPLVEALSTLLADAGTLWDPELVGLLARVLRHSETAQPVLAA